MSSLVVGKEPGVDERIDARAEVRRIDVGQARGPSDELFATEWASGQRDQLGDGLPIAGDRESLPRLDAVEHVAPVVAQLADRDLAHRRECITRETEPERAGLAFGCGRYW